MSLESKIYNRLKSDATVYGIVSTRITPVIVPQNQTYPCLRYTNVSEVALNTHLSNNTDFRQIRLQIDCYAVKYADCVALAKAVKTAMLADITDGIKSTLINDFDDYDSTGTENYYKRILEFYTLGSDS